MLDPKLIALHKHWCTADSINFHLRRSTKGVDRPSADLANFAAHYSTFLALSVWYATLYVVIEGYKDIKAEDPDVDALLANGEYVDALRLFRNATFHYQKDPIPEKLLKFLTAEKSEQWIADLNRAFKCFFERSLPIKEKLEAMGFEVPPQWR